jgi:hypothetical protein
MVVVDARSVVVGKFVVVVVVVASVVVVLKPTLLVVVVVGNVAVVVVDSNLVVVATKGSSYTALGGTVSYKLKSRAASASLAANSSGVKSRDGGSILGGSLHHLGVPSSWGQYVVEVGADWALFAPSTVNVVVLAQLLNINALLTLSTQRRTRDGFMVFLSTARIDRPNSYSA